MSSREVAYCSQNDCQAYFVMCNVVMCNVVCCYLHDVRVLDLAPLLHQPHPVEQPEGEQEDEEEKRQQRSEQVDG